MSRKLEDFISKIKTTGVAHPNLYTVSILPSSIGGATSKNHALLGWSSKDTADICLMCNSAVLPDNSLMTTPSKSYGISPEVPYEKSSGTMTLSFYILADFDVVKFFNHWLKAIYDPETGYFGFKSDYISTISIIMESPELLKEYEIQCFECYPKSVSQIPLSSQHEPSAMVLSVDFTYTYWKEVNNAKH